VVCPVYRPAGRPRLPDFAPVCSGCRERVKSELSEIPDAYALIPASLEPGTGTGVKVSGTRTAPIPVRLDALNLLVGATGTVHGDPSDQHGPIPPLVVLDQWVADWIDVRQRSEHQPVPTISTLTGWLLARLDWALDEHPAVDDFAREVRDTLRAIRGVTEPQRTGEYIGKCPAKLRDESRCQTRLYADPYLDQIACPRCGVSWARRQWLQLAAAQDDVRDDGGVAA
jgi:hypothetical protein